MKERKPSKPQKIADIDRKLENSKRALINADITESDFRKFRDELQAQRDQIMQESDDDVPTMTVQEMLALLENLSHLVKETAENDSVQANQLLRDAVQRLVIYPDNMILIESHDWCRDMLGEINETVLGYKFCVTKEAS